jgi:hypothetical protein
MKTMKTQNMTKVAIYVRVSTSEQAETGVSLEAQIAKCEAYCHLFELEVVEVIEDKGESAKTLKRPGIQRALDLLRSDKVDALVVVKLDRLTRSVADLNTLIERFFTERGGKHLLSINDSIDTRSAGGRLVLNVLCSVAQWEREACAERTREALAHKKTQKLRTGGIPFGYRIDESNPARSKKTNSPVALVENEIEQEALAIVRKLRQQGMSIRAIVEELNKRGVPTAKGGTWHIQTVQRALKIAA